MKIPTILFQVSCTGDEPPRLLRFDDKDVALAPEHGAGEEKTEASVADYNALVGRYNDVLARLDLMRAHNIAQSKGLDKQHRQATADENEIQLLRQRLADASSAAKIQLADQRLVEVELAALKAKLGITWGEKEADRFEGI